MQVSVGHGKTKTSIYVIRIPERHLNLMFFLQRIKPLIYWSYLELICRYRRSFLGPFWEVFNAMILTLGISVIFSSVFGGDTGTNIAYIGLGVVCWGFTSALLVDGPMIFIDKSAVINSRKFPLELLILNKLLNTVIVFLHILPFCIIGLPFVGVSLDFSALLLLPNLIIVSVFGYLSLTIFALLGAIYRDVQMILRNLVQVCFFVTPVFWNPNLVPSERLFIVEFNPLFHLLSLLRNPLLGHQILESSYIFVLTMCVILFFLSKFLYLRLEPKMVLYL